MLNRVEPGSTRVAFCETQCVWGDLEPGGLSQHPVTHTNLTWAEQKYKYLTVICTLWIGEKSLGEPIVDASAFVFPLPLPATFEYLFERFAWINESNARFHCEFRVNATDTQQMDEWIDSFQISMD